MQKTGYSNIFYARMKWFQERVERQIALYEKICSRWQDSPLPMVTLSPKDDLYEVLEFFGPCLPQQKAQIDLSLIYRASFHPPTGSLVIANHGSVFLAQAPFSKRHVMVCHLGASVYQPLNGLESVNIGIVGDIYKDEVLVRAESACAPSFLFGSQRCNCCYQWMSIRELAAYLNPIEPLITQDTEAFERWVEEQYCFTDNRCIPKNPGPGLVMIHFDSQSGMGSGWTDGEFCQDLYSRALLRQLGENRVEHLYHTSIKEGYGALGLPPDGRKEGDHSGYRLTSIILDFLDVNKNLICLSNNQQKLNYLSQRGYVCRRVKSLGQILHAGMREAKQRRDDFAHDDIGEGCVSFEEELARIKSEIFA